MNEIDWRVVITKIQRERKWPLKTIGGNIGASESAVHAWKIGECEPRYSHGAALLRMAFKVEGMVIVRQGPSVVLSA